MKHPDLRQTAAAACGFALCVLFSSCATANAGLAGQNIASEYYAIAEGYAELSKFDKAILYYRKASLRREYANAAGYGLGRMYALSGKWQEACDEFAVLYKKDPDNTLIAGAYAFALASNGQTGEALALYGMLWQKNPVDPQTGRNYAAMLVLAARYEEALALIAELNEKYPDAEALKGIGEIEKKAEDALKPPVDTVADSASENAAVPSPSGEPVKSP